MKHVFTSFCCEENHLSFTRHRRKDQKENNIFRRQTKLLVFIKQTRLFYCICFSASARTENIAFDTVTKLFQSKTNSTDWF